MHRTLRSLRVIFPGIVACFLVLSGLLALSSLKSTDIQIQDTAVVEVASGQPGLAYEIALYSRQLIDAKTDEDRADRTKAIQDGLALFERNQAALRNGDPSLDLPPLQHKEIVGTLDSVDSLWSDYRKLVTQLFTADLNDDLRHLVIRSAIRPPQYQPVQTALRKPFKSSLSKTSELANWDSLL